jgi:hypothetical protein
MTGMRAPLHVIGGGPFPRRDAVARLHQFRGEHPEVRFTSPTMGRYGQFTALILAGTIPGEAREIMLKSPDMCGLMDQLDDHFPTAESTG